MENKGCSITKTKVINTPKIVYENEIYYHEPYNLNTTKFLNSLIKVSSEELHEALFEKVTTNTLSSKNSIPISNKQSDKYILSKKKNNNN